MKLLHYIIELPIIVVAVWGIYVVEVQDVGFSFSILPDEHINVKFVLFTCLAFGYIWGKINSWFAYAPMRSELRKQKKANKNLNKEQEKLSETVDGLQKNLIGLQEKAKLQAEQNALNNPNPTFKSKLTNM